MRPDVYEAIQGIDLTIITRNMQAKAGWSKTKAERVEEQYRRFLALCVDDPTQAVPSEELDDYWEMHVLDTRKYVADCMKTFGFFLHHVPNAIERVDGLSKSGLIDRFEMTKDRYLAKFGEPMKNAVMSVCDDCIPDYDSPSDPDPQIFSADQSLALTKQ